MCLAYFLCYNLFTCISPFSNFYIHHPHMSLGGYFFVKFTNNIKQLFFSMNDIKMDVRIGGGRYAKTN